MPHTNRNRRAPAAAIVLSTLLVALILTGCGESSKASSSTAGAARTKPGGREQFARASALRSCLQKNGVTLPERKPGQRGGPFGAGANGGPQLPKGVTRAQLQAAFKKCGSARTGRGGGAPGAKRRFAKFATCMRKNGVSLPAANTSGKGPVFDTQGIDTTSAAFKAADAKCVRELAQPQGPPAGQ